MIGLDALELMHLRAIDHLPVMDAAGRLLGLVSRRRLGDWIELGGSGQQTSAQGQGALSVGTREVRDSRSVWLKVDEVR